MLRFSAKIARQLLCICCLALFLSSQASAYDSTLIAFESRISNLVYQLSQSIVTVEAVHSVTAPSKYQQSTELVQSHISSGLIIDSIGNILVAGSSIDHSERIIVHYNGLTYDATVRGVDYRTGLALISIAGNPGIAVKMAEVHQCTGQMVIAMGNSYGVRAVPTLGFCAGARADGTVQFSATISSGSVGGGLFDLSGELIGIIIGSLGQQKSPEAGIAVPSISIMEVVGYLKAKGSRPAGYVGITTADFEISPPMALGSVDGRMVNEGPNSYSVDHGVMVTRVVKNSPASRAGLLVGDLLHSINGRDIPSAETLRSLVLATKPGTRVVIGFIRNGVTYSTELQIGQVESYSFVQDPTFTTASATISDRQMMQRQIDSLKTTLRAIEKRLRDGL